MVTGTLFPAAIVIGSVNPRITNSELDDWSEEMVTAAPEAVSVAGRLVLDPTVTLPKLRVAGEMPSCGFTAATPVPLDCSTAGEFCALLTNLVLAEAAAAAVGVN